MLQPCSNQHEHRIAVRERATTLVRLLISLFRRSMALFVRIRIQRLIGKYV